MSQLVVRVAVAAVVSMTASLWAQSAPAAPEAPATPPVPAAPAAEAPPATPEMTPEQMEMMQAWQEYMTPGPEHAELAEMVGTWTAEITDHTMGQQKYTGEAKFEMILGGRYLQQTMQSEMMGMPWSGIGTVAFDNAAGEYVSVWIDSMGTGVAVMRGKQIDDDTVELKGEMVDPVTKGPIAMRVIQKDIEDDLVTFEMYMTPPGAEETKALEIVYKRKA